MLFHFLYNPVLDVCNTIPLRLFLWPFIYTVYSVTGAFAFHFLVTLEYLHLSRCTWVHNGMKTGNVRGITVKENLRLPWVYYNKTKSKFYFIVILRNMFKISRHKSFTVICIIIATQFPSSKNNCVAESLHSSQPPLRQEILVGLSHDSPAKTPVISQIQQGSWLFHFFSHKGFLTVFISEMTMTSCDVK
jgi:hypothetical protein